MAFRQPIIRLNSVDLPTLGRPTIATMGRATGQLDGFWLPEPQDDGGGGAEHGAEPEGGLRTHEGPQRPGDDARSQVRCAVDAVEDSEGGAQPGLHDLRGPEREEGGGEVAEAEDGHRDHQPPEVRGKGNPERHRLRPSAAWIAGDEREQHHAHDAWYQRDPEDRAEAVAGGE